MRHRQPKHPAVLPLGIKNRIQTEMPALVALSAIGEAWFSSTHQSDLLAVALVVQVIAVEDSLEARCAAELQRLCEQEIRLEHKVDIALNLAECLPWLQVQSNARIQRALTVVAARHCPIAA